MKKLLTFIKKFLSFRFSHPIIDTKLDNAIDDKIKALNKEKERITEHYNSILNNHLKTYFSKKYLSQLDMEVAFETINKDWKNICRKANSTEKLISLRKEAFKEKVELVINKLKDEKKTKAK